MKIRPLKLFKPPLVWLGVDNPPPPPAPCGYVHANGLGLVGSVRLSPRYAATVYERRFTGHTLHEVHSKIAAFEQTHRADQRLHSYLIQDI